MSKLSLKKNPTLKDYQDYVALMIKERGFEKETLSELFMLFLEEAGELAKSARKHTDIHIDKNSNKFELTHEASDTLTLLLIICNYLNIDLEKAFREKEEINKKRTWQ